MLKTNDDVDITVKYHGREPHPLHPPAMIFFRETRSADTSNMSRIMQPYYTYFPWTKSYCIAPASYTEKYIWLDIGSKKLDAIPID